LRDQFAGLRDSARHVGTRTTFWSHVCNGPATNAEVGRGVGCPRKFDSEISRPSREGSLGVSWNRGLVTFTGFSRAYVQSRERCIAKEAHVRCRGHFLFRRSARFFLERLDGLETHVFFLHYRCDAGQWRRSSGEAASPPWLRSSVTTASRDSGTACKQIAAPSY